LSDPRVLELGGFLLVLGVIVGAILLVAWIGHLTRHRPRPDPALLDPSERRETALGLSLPGLHLPASMHLHVPPLRPRTAPAAYLRLLADYEAHPALRRHPGETPAVHAARLRRDEGTGVALDLLAADYELARFGGVQLTRREDRRGVARWRRLRPGDNPG